MKANTKEEAIQLLKAALDFFEREGQIPPPVVASNSPAQTNNNQPVFAETALNELEHLKALLNEPDWPEAVPQFLICNRTEADKKERAEGIVDYIDMDLSGKKILDFGCGEGHLVKLLAEKGINATGYDIQKQGELEWETTETGLLTTDWEKTKAQKPYDVVLLYDVLDHATDPVSCLKQLREVCTSDTTIIVRTHPFCGPHGGHLYQKINKAYVHLIFTESELAEMGYPLDQLQKVFYPLATCDTWFKSSGFSIAKNNTVKTFVPDFFKNNKFVRARISKTYPKEFPEWQMSQAFNDYVVKMR